MIFDAARLAFSNLFAPETRSVLWKVIGLTLLVLAGLWLGLRESFLYFAMPFIDQWMPGTPGWAGWLTFVLGLFASFGLALGLALLMAPVTALIAGFFLDEVAEAVERRDYPTDPTGRALPLGEAMLATVKFLGVVIAGNLLALFLLLVPGINLVAFFLVNAYLLSREYFEFAAMRHLPPEAAREFRAKHARTVLGAGIIIAAFLAVPILNLATPLFAGAMMVHLYKRLAARDPEFHRLWIRQKI
ncbi:MULTISPECIES: sulfate transporter family protein [unclassified Rhizobium]|uniref:sulfate transporter family protein n=1 Tax=unclassified Rhizobium TaxID=2613769 RepID=UPI000701799F|nr:MULTISPECIES: sulfate transporter family protein [unclassified Rhizobium]KQV44489.1 cysteine biosynthesis protein CysZ [Rhizobium sp. Root1212]KRD38670.1 cysteine biosynthesis protein CysZ [Rhizobium sp. Root268]